MCLYCTCVLVCVLVCVCVCFVLLTLRGRISILCKVLRRSSAVVLRSPALPQVQSQRFAFCLVRENRRCSLHWTLPITIINTVVATGMYTCFLHLSSAFPDICCDCKYKAHFFFMQFVSAATATSQLSCSFFVASFSLIIMMPSFLIRGTFGTAPECNILPPTINVATGTPGVAGPLNLLTDGLFGNDRLYAPSHVSISVLGDRQLIQLPLFILRRALYRFFYYWRHMC